MLKWLITRVCSTEAHRGPPKLRHRDRILVWWVDQVVLGWVLGLVKVPNAPPYNIKGEAVQVHGVGLVAHGRVLEHHLHDGTII